MDAINHPSCRVPLLFVDEDARLEPMPLEMLVRPSRSRATLQPTI